MAIVSTARSAHQRPNPNIRVGSSIHKKSKAVASDCERSEINKAILALNSAKVATNEKVFVTQMTEAFRLCRNICRSRIL